jgi:hypothetical protein
MRVDAESEKMSRSNNDKCWGSVDGNNDDGDEGRVTVYGYPAAHVTQDLRPQDPPPF